MRAEGIIFDVDGTLAETEEVHRQAFNDTFARFDLPWHWDRSLYRRLLDVTGGKERIRAYVASDDPPQGARALDLVLELHTAKTECYTELVVAGAAKLRPGVKRLIAEARRDSVRLAIATTTSLPNVEALLAAAFGSDAAKIFEFIGAGDVVPRKKPAPDIYRLVLDEMRMPTFACIAVEDSRNGLDSARAAGLPTLVTPSVYTSHQSFPGAMAVVPDLDTPPVSLATIAKWRAADSGW
ncbi:HAD family hydrolase [Ancylobacter sp. 6x-1]|uniref:HAD family hydrolase n=1 Tax=Ancylobacter crimeensis TaxID=2579147 RepID=A0ABT0D8N7_9HYPH|nr:HAD family hydrolase [Ancylobacter crimeensis]MCK0196318.1 HAD family hydrolase [Ancylobacter crimeensis]